MINSCDLRAPPALMTFQSGFSSFQGQMIKSSENNKQKLKQINLGSAHSKVVKYFHYISSWLSECFEIIFGWIGRGDDYYHDYWSQIVLSSCPSWWQWWSMLPWSWWSMMTMIMMIVMMINVDHDHDDHTGRSSTWSAAGREVKWSADLHSGYTWQSDNALQWWWSSLRCYDDHVVDDDDDHHHHYHNDVTIMPIFTQVEIMFCFKHDDVTMMMIIKKISSLSSTLSSWTWSSPGTSMRTSPDCPGTPLTKLQLKDSDQWLRWERWLRWW